MPRTSRFLPVLLIALNAAAFLAFVPVIAWGGAKPQGQDGRIQPIAGNPDVPFGEYEASAEQTLFQLANQSRTQAGLPRLMLDEGMSQSARLHAQAMLEARQLSHRFQGEPSLVERLVATTRLQLDQAGENVAFDFDAERGHQHLMLSAPHRANLLNPNYNVIGLGVVRTGDRLYIVEDFGRALPTYSIAEVKTQVSKAVSRLREQANRPEVRQHELQAMDNAACSMARADKLGAAPVRKLAQNQTVLTYTSLHPDVLPSQAERAIDSPNLHGFSVGVCYARTRDYPMGVYWLVLSLN
jgi:uncharacterized protein YkwD